MNTYDQFSKRFMKEIRRRHFGASPYETRQYELSPGAKELRHTNARPVLETNKFLRLTFGLIRESVRLEAEQSRVSEITKETSPKISSLRDAQKSLKSMAKGTGDVHRRMANLVGWDIKKHLQTATNELTLAIDKLEHIERTLTSGLHPASKVPPAYKRSQWEVLIMRFDYELETLHKKAPRHGLYEELASELQRIFDATKITISDITRYRIIAALVTASGIGPINPATVKQYFDDKNKPNNH